MPNQDSFSTTTRRVSDPAITVFEITPDDGTDLPYITTALAVDTQGKVRVTTADGSVSDVTIYPGHSFPVRVRRVWLTGTTATGIRGLV